MSAADPAKAKWIAIQAVRWTGVGMFLLGLLAYAGKMPLPKEAGYVLIPLGLFEAFFVPVILARKWKTRL